MCEHCWQELGSPRIDTPAVRAAVAAIQVLGEGEESLPFHAVLDDFNVENEHMIAAVRRVAEELDSTIVLFGVPAAGRQMQVINTLCPLSPVERMSAIALAWEIWTC